MSGRFDNKVLLITGAAQGIGKRVAERAISEGAYCILVDRADFLHEIATQLGERAHAVVVDLETFEGAQEAASVAIDKYERIDGLVNNVGGTIWTKPFEYYDVDEIQAEINRSLYPTLWSCRAVLPHMVEQGYGSIVNVSSIATRSINRVPYAAAKGGVNALTASLAMENGTRGIRVNAVSPGGTEAPPRKIARNTKELGEEDQKWYQQIVEQTIDSTLMKRYGTLDEQAAVILFLLSDEASYITGTVLPVGGGDQG